MAPGEVAKRGGGARVEPVESARVDVRWKLRFARRFRGFVAYLDASDAAKRAGGGGAQGAVAAYAASDLGHDAVYGALCRRLGVCAAAARDDPATPWLRPGAACGAAPRLARYENWAHHAWPATREIKHALRLTNEPNCTLRPGHSCKRACYAKNAADLASFDPAPWHRAVDPALPRDVGPWRAPLKVR